MSAKGRRNKRKRELNSARLVTKRQEEILSALTTIGSPIPKEKPLDDYIRGELSRRFQEALMKEINEGV